MTTTERIDAAIEPSDAREYIHTFHLKIGCPQLTYVETSSGKRIEFSEMTDEEAIHVANMLQDLEIEAAINSLKNGAPKQ